MIITQLSTFRGESAVTTWAYRVVVRYLLREKTRVGWTFETLAPVPVRKLIGIRLTPRRRSVRTSGSAVSATADWDRGATDEIREGAHRWAYWTGRAFGRSTTEGRGRAGLRSGDALVAVMEPADLGNGADRAL